MRPHLATLVAVGVTERRLCGRRSEVLNYPGSEITYIRRRFLELQQGQPSGNIANAEVGGEVMVKRREVFDAVIVGAGPAGLSAALVLGRACRNVLLCDNDTPRNWASKAIYGFLTRDGMAPADLREVAGLELQRYPNISRAKAEVSDARKLSDGAFEVRVGQRVVGSRKILIATGVADQLPAMLAMYSR